MTDCGPHKLASIGEAIRSVRSAVSQCVIGLTREIDLLIAAMLANRHVLVEGVPGIGKTHLINTLAKVTGCGFKRIQFTPDLLPSDILGSFVYNARDGDFKLHKGPIFTNVVLADEINRAPAKTQSALLEVMQERQVTIEGATHVLEPPFFVFATQNPLEHEGVYPLPQAQLDRFAMRLLPTYPDGSDEQRILSLHRSALPAPRIAIDDAGITRAQTAASEVTASDEILAVIAGLCRISREHPAVMLGASPRLGLDLLHIGRAWAIRDGRGHVIPDDIKELLPHVANHRIILTPQAELSGVTPSQVIDEILQSAKLV